MVNYDDGYAAEKVDSQHDAKHLEVSADSQLALAADFEDHEMGIWNYPWACAWCVYACWTIILLSFDVQAVGAVVGILEFRKDFGYEFNGDYVLPAIWQSAFSGAPIATAVISSIASAELADYIGRKKVLALALVISFIAVAIEFIATKNPVFFAGKLLNGFMLGAVGTIMVSYIGEITPLALRGIFTCGVGVAYGIGPLVAFIVINYTGTVESRWAYRTVFCCQFGFAGVSAILWPFMPESPWWLVSKGKKEEALESLGRLGHSGNEGRAKLALIERTLNEVKAETDGVTYLECFKKSNLRTIISIMPLCIQSFSGIAFVASYFTCQVGRRNLTFYGLAILTVFLLITGGLGTGTSQPMIKGTVAFILIYSWWYKVSIGSTAFSLLAEVSTSRLRAETVAIGYASKNSINVMCQFVIPYMFNPDNANLGAKIAFIFGGFLKTGGRSYEELDEMFAKGVPARKFKSYKTTVQLRNETAAHDGSH
ncbi:maltose permease MAL31 [Colletotrichum phormii]|uniref:Maltose permease MAL31 n=1 Tax=Colletotrichum phormii TaxID=359342 RepID=A0AAJ0EC17_9PEZI|nr:maltose permease MAL31 [Colletotrichum phormii]KAK1633549.1 maltose permease MAL31 [Colletotrichum phormii]